MVKPRLFAGNISGLNTLLSGAYIGIEPGAPCAEPPRHFTGLEDPPLLSSTEGGRTFHLRTNHIGSFSLGSPVFLRDLDVG